MVVGSLAGSVEGHHGLDDDDRLAERQRMGEAAVEAARLKLGFGCRLCRGRVVWGERGVWMVRSPLW